MHIPATFHDLMTDETSPIIDFYPSTFQIDMNGKRMAWQGVALLPFIEEGRLLDAMGPRYNNLTDDERRRNKWGNNVLFVFESNALYPSLEALYGKRKKDDVWFLRSPCPLRFVNDLAIIIQPMPINTKLSKGMSGSLLPNPDCIPDSTFFSPLTTQDLPDIKNDRSLSAFYFFPKQLTPHRSILLPGVRRPKPILSASDLEHSRRGGEGRGRGGTHHQDRGIRRGGGDGPGGWGRNRNNGHGNGSDWQNQQYGNDGGFQPPFQGQRGRGGGGYGGGRNQYNDFAGPPQRGRGGARGGPPRGGMNSGYSGAPGSFGGYDNASGGYGNQGGYGGGRGGYGGGGGGGGYGGGGTGYGGYGGQSGYSGPGGGMNQGGGFGQGGGYPQGGGYGPPGSGYDSANGGYGGYGGPPPQNSFAQNNSYGGYGGGGGGGPPFGNARGGGYSNRGRGRGGRY